MYKSVHYHAVEALVNRDLGRLVLLLLLNAEEDVPLAVATQAQSRSKATSFVSNRQNAVAKA